MRARDLQKQLPRRIVAMDRILIDDGPVRTSVGKSAGIDLAAALVEADGGQETAQAVASRLVPHHCRAGGQTPFLALLELEPKSARVQSALTYARNNLHRPLTVEALAEAACLSPRQLSRVFHAKTGQSPAKAVEILRV